MDIVWSSNVSSSGGSWTFKWMSITGTGFVDVMLQDTEVGLEVELKRSVGDTYAAYIMDNEATMNPNVIRAIGRKWM